MRWGICHSVQLCNECAHFFCAVRKHKNLLWIDKLWKKAEDIFNVNRTCKWHLIYVFAFDKTFYPKNVIDLICPVVTDWKYQTWKNNSPIVNFIQSNKAGPCTVASWGRKQFIQWFSPLGESFFLWGFRLWNQLH